MPAPTPDDPNQQQATGSGGGGVQAQGVGTGFVNLQSLLSANAGATGGMVQNSLNSAQATSNNATSKLGGTTSGDASTVGLKGLTNPGGLSSILNSNYGGGAPDPHANYKTGGYNQGQNGFDTLLTGAAGNAAFTGAQKAYSNAPPAGATTGPQYVPGYGGPEAPVDTSTAQADPGNAYDNNNRKTAKNKWAP